MAEEIRRWHLGVLALLGVLSILMIVWPDMCWSARGRYGMHVPTCPEGTPRQTLRIEGSGLSRQAKGWVTVAASAVYVVPGMVDGHLTASVDDVSATLALVDAAGKETAIAVEAWHEDGYARRAEIALPDVADGDYRLRAHVSSPLGDGEVDLPLPLYAPARIHLLTDRPLYEPGNTVKFRAVALRARDLSPIEGRPGTWFVRDPEGTVLLEEKAPAGDWGVVAGSFPLDRAAATGAWQVGWRSGNDERWAEFRVEPFELPRFRIEAAADAAYYRAGAAPKVTGRVVYSSGAPIAGAAVEIEWQSDGEWPPPPEWLAALPKVATTDTGGQFALALPAVPDDLRGRANLTARLVATDPAGDRVGSAMVMLLSEDAIQVEAITDLADGLVDGFNNRLYLRVTTADGQPLPGAAIQVKKAWSASDPGIAATLDEDSVARIQIDPGPPVNVVVPAMPVRPAAASEGPAVQRVDDTELIGGDTPLADRVEMDRWLAPLAVCGKWVTSGSANASVTLRVAPAGTITSATAEPTPLARCALSVVRSRKLPAGRARLYSLQLAFEEPRLPELSLQVESPQELPEGVEAELVAAAAGARDCLPRGYDGQIKRAIVWETTAGSPAVAVTWVDSPNGGQPPGFAACVEPRFRAIALAKPAAASAIGVGHLFMQQPATEAVATPSPQVMRGYELVVSATATADGKPIGSTLLRTPPGAIPPLRLRATPALARPGDTIDLVLVRGPGFSGDPPERIDAYHVGQHTEIELVKKKLTGTFAIPADGEGWYEFNVAGLRSLVFVASAKPLAVTIAPAADRYAPGDTAELQIRTRLGESDVAAAVSLFGVDDSLSQLAPLPGPDAMREVQPEVTMKTPLFGGLDGQALALGRIRGSNAAEATILRVETIPGAPDVDAVVTSNAETTFDGVAELTDRFYTVLAELHAQTRRWEASAPADATMTAATMAGLWKQSLDAIDRGGGLVVDGFGRRLDLAVLPPDLLALTDPRQVVVVGTRLPEDVENWSEWVARNRP